MYHRSCTLSRSQHILASLNLFLPARLLWLWMVTCSPPLTTQHTQSLGISLDLPPNAYCPNWSLLRFPSPHLPCLHALPLLTAPAPAIPLRPRLCTHGQHYIKFFPTSPLLFWDSHSFSPHNTTFFFIHLRWSRMFQCCAPTSLQTSSSYISCLFSQPDCQLLGNRSHKYFILGFPNPNKLPAATQPLSHVCYCCLFVLFLWMSKPSLSSIHCPHCSAACHLTHSLSLHSDIVWLRKTTLIPFLLSSFYLFRDKELEHKVVKEIASAHFPTTFVLGTHERSASSHSPGS